MAIWAALGREPGIVPVHDTGDRSGRSRRSRCSDTSSSSRPRSAARRPPIVGGAALMGNRVGRRRGGRSVYRVYPLDPLPATKWDLIGLVVLGTLGVIVQMGATAKGRNDGIWDRDSVGRLRASSEMQEGGVSGFRSATRSFRLQPEENRNGQIGDRRNGDIFSDGDSGLGGIDHGGQGRGEGGNRRVLAAGDVPSRIGEPAGKTSPEELMAASHAACYAMALNATLGRKGGSAARTVVSATVSADKTESGIKLTSSKLKVVAEGLKGIEKSQFAEVAQAAEAGCPISNALRAYAADRRRRGGEVDRDSGSGTWDREVDRDSGSGVGIRLPRRCGRGDRARARRETCWSRAVLRARILRLSVPIRYTIPLPERFCAHCSSVAQWQSIRLLTGGL